MSILLLAALRAKLIGAHSDLQVDKQIVGKVTGIRGRHNIYYNMYISEIADIIWV